MMMPACNALLGQTLGLIWHQLRLPWGLLYHLSMPLQLLKQLVRVGHVLFIVLHEAGTVYFDRVGGGVLERLDLSAPHGLLLDRLGPEKHHLVLQEDGKWLREVFRQALKLLSCLWT